MIQIHNDPACFLHLWRLLDDTRQDLRRRYKRFTPRRIMQTWFGAEATDLQIWEVCHRAVFNGEQLYGLDQLPPPRRNPYKHRVLLCAIVSVRLGIPIQKINLYDIDLAHDMAYPHSRPLLPPDTQPYFSSLKVDNAKSNIDPKILLAIRFPKETSEHH